MPAQAAFAEHPSVQVEPPQFEATAGWDDNITRAAEASSRLGDRMLSIALSRGVTAALGPHTRVLVGAFASAEKMSRFDGLDRLSGGLTAQLQLRPSAAFAAPTFAVFTDLQRDEYRSSPRSGTRFAGGASVRQSWTDRIDAFAAFTASRSNARGSVFDQGERGLRAHVDYAAPGHGTFYAGAEMRRGDVVSTTLGFSDEYARIARANGPDEAFGPGFHAYRLAGRTNILTLGWSLPLDAKRALDFAWRRVLSSAPIPADAESAYGAETLKYRSNLFTASCLLRF